MFDLGQQTSERNLVKMYRSGETPYFTFAEALEKHVTRFGVSQRQLAKELELGQTAVSNYLSVMRLPPQVREEAMQYGFNFKVARALADVRHPESVTRRQLEIAELFRSGHWTSFAERLVAQANREPGRPAGAILKQILTERGIIRFEKPVGPKKRHGIRFQRLQVKILEVAGMLAALQPGNLPVHERLRLQGSVRVLLNKAQGFLTPSPSNGSPL